MIIIMTKDTIIVITPIGTKTATAIVALELLLSIDMMSER